MDQTTSQKHRDFVSEPMGNKPVRALPGVGKVAGERLKNNGYDQASVVLGQFLTLKRDKESFVGWMKDEAGANKKRGEDCYRSLNDWCDNHL